MIDIPEFAPPNIPSLDERINKTTNEVAQKVVDNMANFDADIVLALALIADLLCRANILQREALISLFRSAHDARLSEWKNGYTPLGLLADYIHQAGEILVPSDGKPSASWLREVIDGGLSKKKDKTPEPVD